MRSKKIDSSPKNDDGGDIDSLGRFSIFYHPGRPFGGYTRRLMSDAEMDAAYIYVLLNTSELVPFVE